MSQTSQQIGAEKLQTGINRTGAHTMPLGLVRRFSRERKGSTAIEFGILAVPFFALMFATLESCLSFATQQVLANSADRISRDVRTGNVRVADLSGSKLKELVCKSIQFMVPADCLKSDNLIVDINNYAQFSDVPTKIPFSASGKDIDQTGFAINPGGPGTINHLRIYYKLPVLTDFMRKKMSNMDGDKTLLLATATWRNEPFKL